MAELNSTIVKGNLNTTGNIYENGTRVLTSESHVGDVVSVSATANSGIAIGGTSSNPTVGISSSYKLPTTTEWSNGTITQLSSAQVRITDLDTGIYQLTYRDSTTGAGPVLLYNGTSGPEQLPFYYSIDNHYSDKPLLFVQKIQNSGGTAVQWTWFSNARFANADIEGDYPYGTTTTSSGSFSEMKFSDNDHNYYPSRSYSSGLQISTSQGVSNTCALYVPNATTSQKGVVSVGTGLTASSGALSVSFGYGTNNAARGNHQHLLTDQEPPARYTGTSNFMNNFGTFCEDYLSYGFNMVRGYFVISTFAGGMSWDLYKLEYSDSPFEVHLWGYNFWNEAVVEIVVDFKNEEVNCSAQFGDGSSQTKNIHLSDTTTIFGYCILV